MKNKRIIAIFMATIILSSMVIVGCSKKETYTITKGKLFEVGVDIPEGTYAVKKLDTTNDDTASIGIISSEDSDVEQTNFDGDEVVLKEGTIINSDIEMELTSK